MVTLGGFHSLARDVRERQRGREGDIDRPKPLNLTNHRSIRHHHRLSLFPLCQLSVSSLSLSATPVIPLPSAGGDASGTKGPPAPLVWSDRSHDQQASTRRRTAWLTPEAQPRQKDPEGVNSTLSERFHMTQVRLANKGVKNWLQFWKKGYKSIVCLLLLLFDLWHSCMICRFNQTFLKTIKASSQ